MIRKNLARALSFCLVTGWIACHTSGVTALAAETAGGCAGGNGVAEADVAKVDIRELQRRLQEQDAYLDLKGSVKEAVRNNKQKR